MIFVHDNAQTKFQSLHLSLWKNEGIEWTNDLFEQSIHGWESKWCKTPNLHTTTKDHTNNSLKQLSFYGLD